jgi:hypothetical protein
MEDFFSQIQEYFSILEKSTISNFPIWKIDVCFFGFFFQNGKIFSETKEYFSKKDFFLEKWNKCFQNGGIFFQNGRIFSEKSKI